MSRVVDEYEFSRAMWSAVADDCAIYGCVTGPGRSGAIAAVYCSHLLSIPFIPYGSKAPVNLWPILIVDTARESGATLRKAERRYRYANPGVRVAFEEPPRVTFWYEAPKPQRYSHERARASR